MSGTILIKRSAVAAKVPTTAQFGVGELSANTFDGKLYLRCNNGSDFVQLIGAPLSGASAKTVVWSPGLSSSPVESFEYGQRVYLFAQGQSENLIAWLKIPQSYLAGAQILLRVFAYSPTATNVNFHLTTLTTLIRQNTDAVTSVTNQFSSPNSDQVLNTTANLLYQIVMGLTDSTGKVNSVAVSPGDMLQVTLSRITATGTDDTADTRVVADSAEAVFS